MENQFSRTEMLLGKEAMEILGRARVAVFGVGGVGGFAAEALARSGIRRIDLVDDDTVRLSNLNRQIVATHRTLGRHKVDVMRERILDINPAAEVGAFKLFYLPGTRGLFDFRRYDYVVDAVDTVAAKVQLIMQAKEAGTPVISSMGAGNKLRPSLFEVADISETSVCPLARVMRRECRKRGITGVKVVYSKEEPVRPAPEAHSDLPQERGKKRAVPGSVAFVPPVAGLIIAGEVIADLAGRAARGRVTEGTPR